MIRNLKALGLALAAVLALGALAASVASAATFHSEKETTILTGEGELVFGNKVNGFTVTCLGKYAGTVSGTSVASATSHPTFSNCRDSIGNTGFAVDTSGCDFVLFAETTSSTNTSGGARITAAAEQECTTGNSTIITDTCPITFPAQINLHGNKYDNEGSGTTRDIKVTSEVDGIEYTTPNTFACNLAGLPRTGHDGTLTGSVTVKGFVDNGTTKNATTHVLSVNEGAQVGIWWE